MGTMQRPARWGIGVALLVLTIWLGRSAGRASSGLTAVGQRRLMPLFVMNELDGGVWRMADRRGEVVLVNYWASWCNPCVEETPALVNVARELGPRGLAVVGIAMDEGGTTKVKQFVERFKVPYRITVPPPLSQMAYGMMGLPTTLLIDRQGRLAKTYVGAVRQSDLEEDAGALLAEK